MAPTVRELQKEWQGKVVIVMFDVTNPKYRQKAIEAKIRAVPTMHFIGKDGKLQKELIGALPKKFIEKELGKIAQ